MRRLWIFLILGFLVACGGGLGGGAVNVNEQVWAGPLQQQGQTIAVAVAVFQQSGAQVASAFYLTTSGSVDLNDPPNCVMSGTLNGSTLNMGCDAPGESLSVAGTFTSATTFQGEFTLTTATEQGTGTLALEFVQ